jgi:hypothetical protein
MEFAVTPRLLVEASSTVIPLGLPSPADPWLGTVVEELVPGDAVFFDVPAVMP